MTGSDAAPRSRGCLAEGWFDTVSPGTLGLTTNGVGFDRLTRDEGERGEGRGAESPGRGRRDGGFRREEDGPFGTQRPAHHERFRGWGTEEAG